MKIMLHSKIHASRHPSLYTQVAWVNIEVWDVADCCDIGFEGSGMFFFVMMILFWYRPRMSRVSGLLCEYVKCDILPQSSIPAPSIFLLMDTLPFGRFSWS